VLFNQADVHVDVDDVSALLVLVAVDDSLLVDARARDVASLADVQELEAIVNW